jgi:hypothetical protein
MFLPKTHWDKIRRTAYAHYDYRCAICGQDNTTLYGHEDWCYDYDNEIQQLAGILALCKMCHMCNHLGFAGIQAQEGKLDYAELVAHWCRVNNADEEEFKTQRRLAFELWNLRNNYNWKIVDPSGKPIDETTTSDDILNDLWK